MIELSSIPIINFTNANTIRLIPKAYINEPAMKPLVDSVDELKILEELERQTSGRQNETIPLPLDFSQDELLTEVHGYGWTYVNAAFCHTRPTGNRFNGPERGAWYAAWGESAIDSALSEVCWHLGTELSNTGIFENVTDYGELLAGFTADFHDLRTFDKEPFLGKDPQISYQHGQSLAKGLRSLGSAGILYPSIRHNDGNCLTAFRPNLVQNIRRGNSWRVSWNGGPAPEKIVKL